MGNTNIKTKKAESQESIENNITNYEELVDILSKNSVESSYEDNLEEEAKKRDHKRKEDSKDFFHNLNLSIGDFFLNLSKIVIGLYIFGLFVNTFFGTTLNLGQFEKLSYTIVSIGIGVLLDKTFFNHNS